MVLMPWDPHAQLSEVSMRSVVFPLSRVCPRCVTRSSTDCSGFARRTPQIFVDRLLVFAPAQFQVLLMIRH